MTTETLPTTLRVLRATPGSGNLIPAATLFAIARRAEIEPTDARIILNGLVACGLCRPIVSRYGRDYCRTPEGDQAVREAGRG